MDIGFFISVDNRIVQLPVNPEKLSVSYSGSNKTSEIIGLGEINILRDRKLSEISFSSFFPQNSWFPAVRTRGEFKDATFYKTFIQDIVDSKKPCRFVVTGIDISMKVSIESFDYYHQGGDHEDAYYSLKLKEYRDYHITQISSYSDNTMSLSGSAPPATPLQPSEITVGAIVVVNGMLYRDSAGIASIQAVVGYKCMVSLIDEQASYPYHLITPTGDWIGWASKESVTLA
jgi:hypothetical protein